MPERHRRSCFASISNLKHVTVRTISGRLILIEVDDKFATVDDLKRRIQEAEGTRAADFELFYNGRLLTAVASCLHGHGGSASSTPVQMVPPGSTFHLLVKTLTGKTIDRIYFEPVFDACRRRMPWATSNQRAASERSR